MYKLLNMIRKSEFVDSNFLQCNILVALLLVASVLSIAGYSPPIGPLTKMHRKNNTTFFALYFEAVFCSNMDFVKLFKATFETLF